MQTTNAIRTAARILLGTFLITAGTGDLTFLRKDFRAQVTGSFKKDDTVLYSGIAEIILSASLILAGKNKKAVGKSYCCIFCGCVSRQCCSV